MQRKELKKTQACSTGSRRSPRLEEKARIRGQPTTSAHPQSRQMIRKEYIPRIVRVNTSSQTDEEEFEIDVGDYTGLQQEQIYTPEHLPRNWTQFVPKAICVLICFTVISYFMYIHF